MGIRKSSSRGKQLGLRHAWLASLGAAVVTRRRVLGAVATMADEASRLRGRAAGAAGEVVAFVRDGVEGARTRLQAGATKAKKPAAGRPQARGAGRKPAARKKATPRPASARKRAERRVASKGR